MKEQNIWLEMLIRAWDFVNRVSDVGDIEREGCSRFGTEFGNPATHFSPLGLPPKGRSPRNSQELEAECHFILR